MTPLGPHSRPGRLAIVDNRTAEGRRLKTIRAELEQHVGGRPSVTQGLLIQRIATLLLRIELMDKRDLAAGMVPERDTKQYLAWCNSAARMLRQLGLKGAAERTPTIADYIASRPEPAAA